jgi:hypothetical protein
MGFTALERNYAAATDFATNHADQMRISDYLALDLRRALSVVVAGPNDATINIPSYYDSNHSPQDPTLASDGSIYYGTAGSSVAVHYYLSAGTIYRQEGAAATPVALAVNVADFTFSVVDAGKVVTTQIKFSPTFVSSGASANATAGTTFYNTTLLRNTRIDTRIGIY